LFDTLWAYLYAEMLIIRGRPCTRPFSPTHLLTQNELAYNMDANKSHLSLQGQQEVTLCISSIRLFFRQNSI
jgi:hypothetical protein